MRESLHVSPVNYITLYHFQSAIQLHGVQWTGADGRLGHDERRFNAFPQQDLHQTQVGVRKAVIATQATQVGVRKAAFATQAKTRSEKETWEWWGVIHKICDRRRSKGQANGLETGAG